jgi:hypothetical protein
MISPILTNNELTELANFLIGLNSHNLSAEYTNHRGAKSVRKFRPIVVWYGTTEYHKTPGLFLKAYDLEKKAERDFKMTDFSMETFQEIP